MINHHPKIISDGLILHLDAANKKSYTGNASLWTDLTKNKNNLTLFNSPSYDSANGGSVVFNNTTNYGTLPITSTPTGNEITIGVWNYGITADSITECLIYAADSAGNRIVNIHLPINNSVVYWDCGIVSTSFDRIQTAALNDNQWKNSWHYWVFTKNAAVGTMEIYLDGVLNVSGTGKTRVLTTPTSITFAKHPTGDYMNSKIAKFEIYNKSLTATQILQNYRATKGRFGL